MCLPFLGIADFRDDVDLHIHPAFRTKRSVLINALVMGTFFRPLPILRQHPQDPGYQMIRLQTN